MVLHDPISDLLTRIRNASAAKHRFVDLYKSKLLLEMIRVLKEQGFVDNYLVNDEKKKVRIFLRYSDKRDPVVQGIKRISMPGLRRYVGSTDIPVIRGGMGIAIVSTSKGIFDGESARNMNVGGELLCLVW